MTVATIYPDAPGKILMLGLGGRLDLDLSRTLPAGRNDHHGRDRRRRDRRRQDLFRAARDRARALSRRRRARVPQPHHRALRSHPAHAYRGGYVPFHLLTARVLRTGEAAAHARRGRRVQRARRQQALSLDREDARRVFPALDLYPTGTGEVIAIAPPHRSTGRRWNDEPRTCRRATARAFRLPQLLQRRTDRPQAQAANGDLITDDFAPADVYDRDRQDMRRRK